MRLCIKTVTIMTQPKPRYAPRCTILTPLGRWHAARLKLLARLAGKCKVAK